MTVINNYFKTLLTAFQFCQYLNQDTLGQCTIFVSRRLLHDPGAWYFSLINALNSFRSVSQYYQYSDSIWFCLSVLSVLWFHSPHNASLLECQHLSVYVCTVLNKCRNHRLWIPSLCTAANSSLQKHSKPITYNYRN